MRHRYLWMLFFVMMAFPAQAEKLHCPSPGPDDEANREIARRFFRMGSTYVGKDHRKTVEHFECVLKLVPYSLAARYHLAKALDALRQYSRARENYTLILSDSSLEATKYHEEIRARLKQIENLPDELLPDEDAGTDSEEIRNYREKVRLQQERIRQLEEEKNRVRQDLDRQLKELDAQGVGDVDARRRQILEEYRKKEAEKLQELDRQLARLRELEKWMGRDARPRYREVPRPMRRVGMWVTAGGLALGVGAGVAGALYLVKMSSADAGDDKERWSQETSTPVLWSTSDAKKNYDELTKYYNWTLVLGVAAGLVAATGAILYLVGGSDRVQVSGEVQAPAHGWRILPAAGPGSAGFVIQASW